ncbi:MAG: hypothetical protein ABR592_07590, partial [Nitriliruptorales bacterium]
ANGTRLLVDRAEFERGIEEPYRQLLLAEARLDLPPEEVMPGPELVAPYLSYHELRQMRQLGKLPSDEDVTRDWELAALTVLKVSTSRALLLPLSPPGGGPSVITRGPGWIGGTPGCLRLEPHPEPSELVLDVAAPVALPLRASANNVGVFLRDEDGTTSHISYMVRLEHVPNYLNLNFRQQRVVLTFPSQASFTLCGLAAS